MKTYFTKNILKVITIICLLLNSEISFAQWVQPLGINGFDGTLKVTSSEGSVAGNNTYYGSAFFGTTDANQVATNGWITSTFNALGQFSRFKATAGKPVTLTIEFDNLPYADSFINGFFPGLFGGGLGSNEQTNVYDSSVYVPLVGFVDSPRKFTFQTTVTFPRGRSEAWFVIGFYHNYHGIDITQANQYSIVLPFIVEGVKEPSVPMELDGSGQPRIITQPSLPITVLHAPPGDQSYTKFESGKTSCQSQENKITEDLATSGNGSVKLGYKGSVGFVATIDIEAYVEFTASGTEGNTNVKIKNTETCVTTTTGFGASAGSGEDIFVCEGLDFNYAIYDQLFIDPNSNYSTYVKRGLAMVPVDGSKRLNLFTKSNILEQISTLAADTLNLALDLKQRIDAKNQLNIWKQLIAINDANVANANVINPAYPSLINLSGGTFIDNTTSVNTSQSQTLIVDHYVEANAGLQAVVNIGGSGFSAGFNVRTSKSYGQTNSITSSDSQTISMHLEDNDAGDLFKVNIYRDPMFGTPLYKLQNGSKSSCPYEGGYQRDQPSLRFSALPNSTTYTVPNVAVGTTSQFGINLCNNSNETRTYNLRFNPLSNANNAIISVTGTTGNTEFGAFPIPANSCLANTYFVNVVQQNLGALTSPDLNMELYSACDGNSKSDIFATTNWGNYALPTGISTGQVTICQGAANSNVSLTANCPSGITTTWYNSLTGTPIGTGSPFVQSPNVSSNYYVSCTNGIYNYPKFPANSVQVNPVPSAPIITESGPLQFCNGGSVTLNSYMANNNALNFVKANSQYVTVPHSASINLGTSFTMEAWVNYSGINSTIVDKGNYDFLWQLNANGNSNKMGFFELSTGTWKYSTGIVPENTWTHVAITLSGGTLTFYINGVASGTAAVASVNQDNQPMNIGRQQPSACVCNHFNGTMDELRLWNYARTPSQILANMTSTPANTSGLVAYYKFDETSGNTIIDASGNNNTGTLVNTPTRQIPSNNPSNATNVLWTPSNTTASSITAATSGTYTATLMNSFGCTNAASRVISVGSNAALVTLSSPGDDFSSGTVLRTASSTNGKISATNKIIGVSKVTYNAKSIELNAGFNANSGTVFLAEVGGCN